MGAGILTGSVSERTHFVSAYEQVVAYQVPDSLSAGRVFRGSRGRLALRIKRVLRLRGDHRSMGSVLSVARTGDNGILAIREGSSEIVLYDSTGRRSGTIGSWGRGRLNFDRPKIVRVFDDSVVVWDEGSGKYLFYSVNGRFVRSRHGFAWPVLDFAVDGERLVAVSRKTETTLMLYSYDPAADSLRVLRTVLLRVNHCTDGGRSDHDLRELTLEGLGH
jgi:hypothetical protein